jgi:hypothetical protein
MIEEYLVSKFWIINLAVFILQGVLTHIWMEAEGHFYRSPASV